MNNKTERVFRGYLDLTPSEKADLREEIRKYENFTEAEQDYRRRETIRKIDLGPLSQGGCPCCGR